MPQKFQAGDCKLIWAEDRFMRELDGLMMKNMAMALTFLKLQIQLNVSKPALEIEARGRKGGYRRIGKLVHSKPGEFPRLIEGDLRRSIFRRGPRRTGARGRIIEGDVGTALDYAVYHEISPKSNRSFLRRTLMEERKKIEAILSQGRKK